MKLETNKFTKIMKDKIQPVSENLRLKDEREIQRGRSTNQEVG